MGEEARSQACGSEGVFIFYEAAGIPAESCLLADSREEGLAFPKGDLTLGFCDQCGFIQNTRFDSRIQQQTSQYEDSQAASPTFGSFAREVAAGLIERHRIKDKHVIEIGCGQGEFLALICELGGNSGIGIDPLASGDRVGSAAGATVSFIPENFSESHGRLPFQLICCRHTLEHIRPVKQFLDTVRRAIGARDDVVVFFEVPDVGRILRETAFWDIYYEHCSYFSMGSLARLFRSSEFEIIDLKKGFGDQYLLIEARPGVGPGDEGRGDEETPEELSGLVEAFSGEVVAALDGWRKRFNQYARDGGATTLWGSGSKAVAFISSLGLTEEVNVVVDIDPRKQGRFLPGTGHEIVGPEYLTRFPPNRIVVMNPVYLDEIGTEVDSLGIKVDLIPAC